MLTKVYRSGIVEAPKERGPEAKIFALSDDERPAGRQGRTDAIFASPSLKGVARWVHASFSQWTQDPFVREITVESDSVYVYSIPAWEKVCWYNASHDSYWKTGITLTEYLELSSMMDYFNPTEWEILLSPADVLSVSDVTDEDFLEACRNSYDQHLDLTNSLSFFRDNLAFLSKVKVNAF
jgi:hypothetical protein